MTYEEHLDEVTTLITEKYDVADQAAIKMVMRAQADDFFSGHDDGLWYVKEKEWADIYNGGPKDAPVYRMAEGQATVPENLVESAIESAEECPGECIFIEVLD